MCQIKEQPITNFNAKRNYLKRFPKICKFYNFPMTEKMSKIEHK